MLDSMVLFLSSALFASGVGKLGLCCEECNATQYAPFAAAGSWVYRYSLFVDNAESAKWIVGNGLEFVPHLAHLKVPLPDGNSCTFDAASAVSDGVPLCTAEGLDAALATNVQAGLATKFLCHQPVRVRI